MLFREPEQDPAERGCLLQRKDAGEGGTFPTAYEGRLCREVFISSGGTKGAWH